MDPRPALDTLFSAFGVPATVTPYGAALIATTVIVGGGGGGADVLLGAASVPEHLQRVTLRRSVVGTALAPGSTIQITGGLLYGVDATEYEDDEIVRVVVRP